MMPCVTHTVTEQNCPDLRLDRYVSENLGLLSRSQIKSRKLNAKINGKNVKLSRIVKTYDILDLSWEDSPPVTLIPQDIPLDIIYEDKRCAVINKAQGMVVHPGAGNRQGTLANALCYKMQSGKLTESIRPGIVHRLDKDTSGVIITSFDDEANAFLSDQFKARKVKKIYAAIICGTLNEKTGKIETFITRNAKDRKSFTVSFEKGRKAVTFYKTIKTWKNYSLVLLRPKTGRTHQLRVHTKYLGFPILGDPVYGSIDRLFPDASLMLHSKSLEIILPGKKEAQVFSVPLPQRFYDVMEKLNKTSRGANG